MNSSPKKGFISRHPVWSFLALLVVTSTTVSLAHAAFGTPTDRFLKGKQYVVTFSIDATNPANLQVFAAASAAFPFTVVPNTEKTIDSSNWSALLVQATVIPNQDVPFTVALPPFMKIVQVVSAEVAK